MKRDETERDTTATEKRGATKEVRERETQRSEPPSTDLSLSPHPAPATTPATPPVSSAFPPPLPVSLFSITAHIFPLAIISVHPYAYSLLSLSMRTAECSCILASINDRPAPNQPRPAHTIEQLTLVPRHPSTRPFVSTASHYRYFFALARTRESNTALRIGVWAVWNGLSIV